MDVSKLKRPDAARLLTRRALRPLRRALAAKAVKPTVIQEFKPDPPKGVAAKFGDTALPHHRKSF
jgi:hypothetical protein